MTPSEYSCAIVELELGKYEVTSLPDVQESRAVQYALERGVYGPTVWSQGGKYCGMPHIIVKGNKRQGAGSEDEFRKTIEDVVKHVEANLASHRGWKAPPLETITAMLRRYVQVSSAEVIRPS